MRMNVLRNYLKPKYSLACCQTERSVIREEPPFRMEIFEGEINYRSMQTMHHYSPIPILSTQEERKAKGREKEGEK